MNREERLEKLLTGEVAPGSPQARAWFVEEPDLEVAYLECVGVEQDVARRLAQTEAEILAHRASAAQAKFANQALEKLWAAERVKSVRRRIVVVEIVLAAAAAIVVAVWLKGSAREATPISIPLGSKLEITKPHAGVNPEIGVLEEITWSTRQLPAGVYFLVTITNAQGEVVVDQAETNVPMYRLSGADRERIGKRATIRVSAREVGSSSSLSIAEVDAQLGG